MFLKVKKYNALLNWVKSDGISGFRNNITESSFAFNLNYSYFTLIEAQ